MMYNLELGRKAIAFTDVSKADEKTHSVFGVVVDEVPDSDGEICDYDPTAKYYKEWSESAYSITSQSGQEPSYGNVRLQHTLEIAGKALKPFIFDDGNKKIYATTTPIDDRMWNIVWRGFVTGYSQGGKYAYRICGECGADCGEPNLPTSNNCPICNKKVLVHYACKPAEISYVDKSSIPTAWFLAVKSDGSHEMRKAATEDIPIGGKGMATASAPLFTLDDVSRVMKLELKPVTTAVDELNKKKDGPETKRVAGEDLPASSFAYVGDPDEVGTWHYPIKFSTEEKTKSHIRNALSQWRKPKGQQSIPSGDRSKVYAKIVSAARRHGIEVSSEKVAAAAGDLRKDMSHVGFLAEILMRVRALQAWTESEGNWENDVRDAEIAESLRDWIADGILILKEIVDEESDELINPPARKAASTQGGNTMSIEELQKAARASLSHHFKKAAGHFHEMATHHKALADEHAAAEETHKSTAAVHKAAAESHGNMLSAFEGIANSEAHVTHHKAMKAHHTDLHGHHLANAAHHKALSGHHLKLHKCTENMGLHCDKMCAAHETDDGLKAIHDELQKAAGIDPVAAPPASATPVPPAPAPVTPVASVSQPDNELAKSVSELAKGFGELKELLSKSLDKPAASSAPAALYDRSGDNMAQRSSDDTGL
jgi:hypothetical protein